MNDQATSIQLKRSELARLTDCNLETIRYYEKTGMMPDPPRSGAGYRVYDTTHVARLHFILRCRKLGFKIAEIRGLLDLVDGGDYTCELVRDMTLTHLADIRRKITDLKRMERVLKEMTARCNGGDIPDCPIIETLSTT